MERRTSLLLVTANVGSIFEDPNVMLDLWIQEFLQTVSRLDVKFIALHCQEVGGKNYETRMKHVENFVQVLLSCDELKMFDKAEIFLDEDFSCAENFTALGNFYFIHKSVTDVGIWDFEDLKFQNIASRNVHSGNIESVSIKEKAKFPQNFFPECKWSRKGFLRTRWNINGTIFDLVNIHLFHDASNFVAMQAFPSVYTVTRQKALQFTLNRFYNYEEGSAPFFVFGDFNFRTDTRGVIKKLTAGLSECKDSNNSEDGKVEYKDDTSEVVITIGKKEFSHTDHQNIFVNDSGDWLKGYDREMEAFKEQLFEYPIQFLPSYPFEESSSCGRSYMRTRCPAWCDRVLLSTSAKQLITEADQDAIEYGVIGKDSCMGDHKPVYLYFNLVNSAGTISTKLPLRRVCSACKSNSNAFCDASNDPAVASKCHFSCSSLADAPPPVVLPCSSCKKHHRNISRCVDSSISVMSVVTEMSDRVSDADMDSDTSQYLAASIPTLSDHVNIDNTNLSNYKSFDHSSVTNDGNFLPHHNSRTPFYEDNVSLNYLHEKRNSNDYVGRPLEAAVAVRCNSASTVVESSWRSKTCMCVQDTSWRMRSVSSSSRTSSWNSDGRVRLKSDPNLKTSLPRIQSHHSSSDEEWFEEVQEPEYRKSEKKRQSVADVSEIVEYIEFDATPTTNEAGESVAAPLTSDLSSEKSRKRKYFLFCIPRRWSKGDSETSLPSSKLKDRRHFKFLSSKKRKSRLCCAL